MTDYEDDHEGLIAEEYRVPPRRADDGQPDPIAEAFRTYRRPPADVVPHRPVVEGFDELALDAMAGQTVELSHYDFDLSAGITKYTELVTV